MDKIKIPSPEERRLEATELDIASILFGSMEDKMRISQVESELGNALVEIMTLKMGGTA